MIDEAERIARLRLIRSESVGPITFYRLLARFGSAVQALEELPHMTQRAGKKKSSRIMTFAQASNELSALDDYSGRMVVFGDDDYPQWLSTIDDAPPVLSILGNADLLSKSMIAIVGARNASANAKRYAQSLSQELGKKGQIIASGLARGIDTAAHQASLATGTIAVMAGGIDQIYPSENTDLYHKIAQSGCVVSEMPFSTAPTAHHFPRRNRIVSGLAKGVVVVEASMRSGSLITARLAGEQGREVFAVPGFPGDPRAAGPNYLIQNGAKLVQTANDILEEIIAMDNRKIQCNKTLFDEISESDLSFDKDITHNEVTPNTMYDLILLNLSHTAMDVDALVRACDVPIAQLNTALLDLELAGAVERHAGNKISKIT